MTTQGRRIPFSRPSLGEEEAQAAAATITSGWVVGGPRLAELEERFAAICGVSSAVGVSSWTTGAFLVLKALGIGPGDEVIVPSLTFIASVNVVRHVGATPVFADIDPATLNIDPADVALKITERTRAVIPVDQIGLPCEIDQISELCRKHNLALLHDAACSLGSTFRGAPVGSRSPVTVFSLHARKVVTTGEGGMIVTDDPALAARLRRLRHQGMSLSDYDRHQQSPTVFETYPEIGYNFRLTDIQAAIGVVQLQKLESLLSYRNNIAQRYFAGLQDLPLISLPAVPAHVVPNWQSFQVEISENGPYSRNQVMEELFSRGIETRRGVMASHLEAPYLEKGVALPHTERAARQGMLLPMYADMPIDDVDFVIRELRALV